jgi:hypothetical protein
MVGCQPDSENVAKIVIFCSGNNIDPADAMALQEMDVEIPARNDPRQHSRCTKGPVTVNFAPGDESGFIHRHQWLNFRAPTPPIPLTDT